MTRAIAIGLLLLSTSAFAEPIEPSRECKYQILTYDQAAALIDAATDALVKGEKIADNAEVLRQFADCLRASARYLREISRRDR